MALIERWSYYRVVGLDMFHVVFMYQFYQVYPIVSIDYQRGTVTSNHNLSKGGVVERETIAVGIVHMEARKTKKINKLNSWNKYSL